MAARPPEGFAAGSAAGGGAAASGFGGGRFSRHALLAEVAILHAGGLTGRFHLLPLGGAFLHSLGVRRRGYEGGSKSCEKNARGDQ